MQMVLSGFSVRLLCFIQSKTVCRYGCIYLLAAFMLWRSSTLTFQIFGFHFVHIFIGTFRQSPVYINACTSDVNLMIQKELT